MPPQFTIRGMLILCTAVGVQLLLLQIALNAKLPAIYNNFAFHLSLFWFGATFGGVLGTINGTTKRRTWMGMMGGLGIVAIVYALALMFHFSRSI